MATVAVYHETDEGMTRLGTFTPRGSSIRFISEQFFAKNPHLVGQRIYIASRYNEWIDQKLLHLLDQPAGE